MARERFTVGEITALENYHIAGNRIDVTAIRYRSAGDGLPCGVRRDGKICADDGSDSVQVT